MKILEPNDKQIINDIIEQSEKKTISKIVGTFISKIIGVDVENTFKPVFADIKRKKLIRACEVAYKYSNDKDFKKLSKQLDDKTNREYLSYIVDYIFESKSILGTKLLGVYIGKIKNKENLTYADWVIMKALSALYDFEINAYINLYIKYKKLAEKTVTNGFSLKTAEEHEYEILSRYKSLSIIAEDTGGISFSSAEIRGRLTDISKDFYNLITNYKKHFDL